MSVKVAITNYLKNKNYMQTKKYISLVAALATVGSLALAASAFAQTAQHGAQNGGRFGRGMMNREGVPMIVGTVSAVNGNSITVTGRNATPTIVTYTVDATNATVTKNNTASTVSAIAVGDTIAVQGTVSGTNVTAKTIRDGVMGGPRGVARTPQDQPQIQGNGQPVVAGKVTTVSGNSITITNNSNVTYTIDATNAKFVVGGVTNPTISNVTVGDNLVVQGTVNGNSVTATSVIDQKAPVVAGVGSNSKPQGGFGGMMDGIGNFFKKMFGF